MILQLMIHIQVDQILIMRICIVIIIIIIILIMRLHLLHHVILIQMIQINVKKEHQYQLLTVQLHVMII